MSADVNPGSTGGKLIRVLVADYTRIHTRLLADALSRHADLQIIPFESDSSGLAAAAAAQNVDVLVISSNLDEQPSRGLEILQELRSSRPDIRTVLLLGSSKDEAVVQAFRAGARGVFGRNDSLDLLSKCVRCVHNGEIWANSPQLSLAIGALANSPIVRAVNAEGMNLLSDREVEVVRCLAEGLTNREIGARLKLSQHTIKNYLFRVFNKLGVSSRVELLFMTLSHRPLDQSSSSKQASNGHGPEYETDTIRKSAEAGLPSAQLAMAQLHMARRGGPQDLIAAYMWYLLASERTRQARELVKMLLTPEQIEEAQRKAATWIPSRSSTPAASIPSAPSAYFTPANPPSTGAATQQNLTTRQAHERWSKRSRTEEN